MIRLATLSSVCLVALAACGGGDEAGETAAPEAMAPEIGTAMESPVAEPFCYFVQENAGTPLTGPDARYVFVTDVGESVYHGYAKLDGEVQQLTEVEAGFGAGMETRRYVSEEEDVELEVILLDDGETEDAARYTGSVRVIYPVEGKAVKFYGECGLQDEAQ